MDPLSSRTLHLKFEVYLLHIYMYIKKLMYNVDGINQYLLSNTPLMYMYIIMYKYR